jgi:hypothetical protein
MFHYAAPHSEATGLSNKVPDKGFGPTKIGITGTGRHIKPGPYTSAPFGRSITQSPPYGVLRSVQTPLLLPSSAFFTN